MRRLLPLLVATALIAAACGSESNDDSASTSPPESDPVETTPEPTPDTTGSPAVTEPIETPQTPETTGAPEVTPTDLAGPGPYAVGVTTRTLPEGGLVEIWYPADRSAAGGTDTYALRDFLPPALAGLVSADVDDTVTSDASRDAASAPDGPFPIVLLSHGAVGYRLGSSLVATHLASWGIVTASTDHPSRDLANFLGGTAEGQPPAADQMRSMRTYLTTLDQDPLLGGALDNGRIALAGHSAGGGTVAEVALDDGILGYVSYASGLRDDIPTVPSLFLAGEQDGVIEVARTVESFDIATSPSWLWVFADTGHHGATDVCVIGGGEANLVELAEATGLGEFIDERLRALATDGCDDPNRPVIEVFPGVYQSSTGFFRWVFGIDPDPIGLDESAVTDGVTITSK